MTASARAVDAPDVLELDGHEVALTHPARVLWPRTGFRKRDLVDYLLAIAPTLLPHIRGRGLTLRRFPEGVDGPGWFQAECRGCPSWMRTFDVAGRGGRTWRYCIVDDAAGLAWTANLGTLELHPFLSTIERPTEPTALVLDLDPGPPAGLLACARVALLLRLRLASVGLEAWPKTSGSVGLHVYVPLAPGHTFDQTKTFARSLAAELAAAHPDLVTDVIDRSRRAGLVYLDWIQNDASRSTVAAYSLRATPWPLVSTPVTWEELEDAVASSRPESLVFTPRDVLARVDRLGDLFAPLAESSTASIEPA
ncbi:MAG TPA: non-homologous end-joining DNA ligase [Candidatus Limnocylindrales bacterium]|nr:non-homologous end-joining DNA ligase [Candidatus Limnocylindrales bacterium]